MAYDITFKPAALRDLKKLPQNTQQRIFKGILDLAKNPRGHGIEKLRGYESLHRFRVGDFRVIFEINEEAVLILIIRIGHRKEIYSLIAKA